MNLRLQWSAVATEAERGRTRLKVMRLEGRDYVAVAVIILLTAGIIVANKFLPAVI